MQIDANRSEINELSEAGGSWELTPNEPIPLPVALQLSLDRSFASFESTRFEIHAQVPLTLLRLVLASAAAAAVAAPLEMSCDWLWVQSTAAAVVMTGTMVAMAGDCGC